MTTLAHLANHRSTNIGNAALILGLERVLREDLGDLDFVEEPWDLYSQGHLRFDRDFVDRVNATDGLLVGAAVAIDGRDIYRNTGMRFDLPFELWDAIERPIVFYGISHSAWQAKPHAHLDRLRLFAERVTTDERVLFSVRNDGTKAWLERVTGVASDRIRVAPDPAVYVPVRDSPHPELRRDRVNVVVSLNEEHDIYRFGGRQPTGAEARRERLGTYLVHTRLSRFAYVPEWRVRRGAFLRALAGALARVAQEVELNVVVAAHTFGDLRMSIELIEAMPEGLRQRCVFAPMGLPTEQGPVFYDLYAKADLAISMRIHSMNPTVGLGTPVVPIVSQSRMRDFMADAGLADLCVELLADDLEDQVAARALAALANPGAVRERLAVARAGLRARTAALNADVGKALGR